MYSVVLSTRFVRSFICYMLDILCNVLSAGKTETTKKVLSFLANVAPDHSNKGAGGKKSSATEPGMEDKILQSNPLLEALGNAKTLRNSKCHSQF
jgi:hypothetical protein